MLGLMIKELSKLPPREGVAPGDILEDADGAAATEAEEAAAAAADAKGASLQAVVREISAQLKQALRAKVCSATRARAIGRG